MITCSLRRIPCGRDWYSMPSCTSTSFRLFSLAPKFEADETGALIEVMSANRPVRPGTWLSMVQSAHRSEPARQGSEDRRGA